MTTTGELCARCKAPLASATPGTEVACAYCGFVQRIESGGAAAFPGGRIVPQSARRGLGCYVAVSVLGPLVLAGVGMWLASRMSAAEDEEAHRVTPSHGPRTLHAAELAAWNDVQGHPLDTAGMPGTIGAVDPVATLPWALGVARAWSPDAQVDRVDVESVSPEGVVDARVDGASVRYVFLSPARRTAFANMAAVSDHPNVNVFLRIQLQDGNVTVSQTPPGGVSGEALPPPPTVTCTTAHLLASARSHGLALRPHYDVNLQSTSWEGVVSWRWYVEAPTGTTLDEDEYDPATCEPL